MQSPRKPTRRRCGPASGTASSPRDILQIEKTRNPGDEVEDVEVSDESDDDDDDPHDAGDDDDGEEYVGEGDDDDDDSCEGRTKTAEVIVLKKMVMRMRVDDDGSDGQRYEARWPPERHVWCARV